MTHTNSLAALKNSFESISLLTGEEFFRQLIKGIRSTLQVDAVWIAELHKGQNSMTTLSFVCGDNHLPNFTYLLKTDFKMDYAYPPTYVTLTGTHASLLPMDLQYLEALQEAVRDGELWKLWYTFVPTPEEMDSWIKKALQEYQEGNSVPFVIKRNSDKRIVGSTRFMNIEKDVRRLEIGTTWYSKSVQRSPINTECKLLLLQHAFENLKCLAVEFRTHRLNEQSRSAIARLGAQQDGILRNHRVSSNGTLRDTVVYSITNYEWDSVKSNLLFMLNDKY